MKDKILNLLIILLLSLLFWNFLQRKEATQLPNGSIQIQTTKSHYSIPASIGLVVKNQSASGVVIDTCNDIKINFNGEYITIPSESCQKLTLASSETITIPYDMFFEKFLNTGSYIFEVSIGDKKFISPFTIENKGTISKIFTYVFYAPVYNLVVYLIEFFSHSLGWAIIVVTIIIRILLLWPQHKMLVSQQKLQKIQPKIKAIQEKHKGDAQALGMELMKLYSSEKVNPMGSCGFLAIQMPVLLVIYNVISHITDRVNVYYLYSFLQNFRIDAIITNFYGIDLMGVGGTTGIVLGVLVALVQFIQVKLSLVFNPHQKELHKKETVSKEFQSFMPDPEFLNKFMLYGMPLMVGFFTYSFFAGVGIYWGISTLFGIFQQLFVNKLLKK